jgi:phytoene desaturase
VHIIVIGAGLGGLAAAIRLRAQGHDVVIVEQRDKPGGRAYVFEREGFVFDAGPTIITAPQFIDELFTLSGRRRQDYVDMVPLDPFYRVRFEDGTVFACSGNEDDMERQVAALSPTHIAGYRRFRRAARDIFDAAMPLIDQPADSLGSLGRFAPALVRARAWRSVATVVRRHVTDPRLQQILAFHPLLIGGNPYDAPSIYALIPELEKRWGVWYAMGGMAALVRALAALFRDCGGEIHCGRAVDEILVDERSRRASGVRLRDGERLAADVVVSNADAVYTHQRLVPPRFRAVNTDRKLARLSYGMSVFVLYFGTDRRYDALGHHEILMGSRFRGLLDDVFHAKRLSPDFSLYLHHPTASDPSLAPPGCDAWYALAPVPHLGGSPDWERDGDALRDRIVRYLEARYLPNLSRHIVTECRVDPRHFRDVLNTPFGGAFSVEPRLTQSAWFRPHNESADVRGLFLVGAGTHPGAGIPGVLSSAKIVASLVARTGRSAASSARAAFQTRGLSTSFSR